MQLFVLSLLLAAAAAMSIQDISTNKWNAFKIRNIVFGSYYPPITSAVITNSYEDLVKQEWNNFKLKYNKSYDSEDSDNVRMNIFIENKIKTEQHNARYARGEVKFQQEINKFSDMLPSEYRKLLGYRRSPRDLRKKASYYLRPANVGDDPDKVDWRDKGYVTDVKNQGHCGSCWAFSTTGALEGQTFRKTGKLVSLSEQNLIDCAGSKYYNNGCQGGNSEESFQYIHDNNGIDTEDSYPYEAQDDQCRYSAKNEGAEDTGFTPITEGDEDALKSAVSTVGPVSVAIDASHHSFQQYKGGLYSEPACSTSDLDHAVLVVGYGTDDDGDYWLVKNSWGEDWGESGYIKMARNQNNMCGIATEASYPNV
uniref:Cathepsin L n=1 Tax=Cacopsylla melanoneura TaxID=428564 RepID=A0A8D8SGW1_9HEMI